MTDTAAIAFTRIDPIAYFAENRALAVPFRKDVTVQARPAVTGETVVTVTSGDHVETTNTAKDGDMLIRNPGGECYLIDGAKFAKRYAAEAGAVADADGFLAYRAVGGPVPMLRLSPNEHVEFTAPWGETMRIIGRGVLADGGGADVYGIQQAEFKETYRPCLEDGTFIPDEIWKDAYRTACENARETVMLTSIRHITDAAVIHSTWEIAKVSMAQAA